MSTSDVVILGVFVALSVLVLAGLMLLIIVQLRQLSRSLHQPRPSASRSFAATSHLPMLELEDVDELHRRWDSLTPREREVARLVVGHTDGEIARLLGISEKTVSNHLYNIYGKLEINSRGELKYLIPDGAGKSPPAP
jgi:DNA-binding CsgD family transcriptional regulator